MWPHFMKKKPSKLAYRIERRFYYGDGKYALWEIVDQEVARESKIKFKTDANGKILVVKDGVVIGAQG
jgi:hypothetical protein